MNLRKILEQLAILRNRTVFLLWSADLVSGVGSWLTRIALWILVYDLTGSALATSVVMIVNVFPGIAFGMVTGVLVDRWNRKHVMIVADLIRCGLVLTLVVASSVYQIYFVIFLSAAMGLFFGAARSAAIPILVDKEDLITVNSLFALAGQTLMVVGPSLAGFTVSWLGVSTVFFLDALTFLCSVMLIGLITSPSLAQGDGPLSLKSFSDDFREGLQFSLSSWSVQFLLIVIGIATLGYGVYGGLLVVFVNKALGAGPQAFGIVTAALGLGAILSPLFLVAIGKLFRPDQLLSTGIMVDGIASLLLAFSPSVLFSLPWFVVNGATDAATEVGETTLLQQTVPENLLGRVLTFYGTFIGLVNLVSVAIAGLVADVTNIRATFAFSGLALILAGILGHLAVVKLGAQASDQVVGGR